MSEQLTPAERYIAQRHAEKAARKGVFVPREVVSFARRDGRNPGRNAVAWSPEMAHWHITPPRRERVTSVATDWRLDPEAAFGRDAPLILEIGSGTGDAVLAHAAAFPQVNHLAVEVFRPGLARTVVHADREGLGNIRVIEANGAELVTNNIAEGSVAEVHIWFADPWPKPKHHKRRLLVAPFMRELARVLQPGGVLRMATDWANYAEQIEREAREVAELTTLGADGSQPPLRDTATDSERVAAGVLYGQVARYEYRPMTRFEAKGRALERPIADFALRRV